MSALPNDSPTAVDPEPGPASWSLDDARETYRLPYWGSGYFEVSEDGEVQVLLADESGNRRWTSLAEIARGLEERGLELPILLRFPDILEWQITRINHAFHKAIRELNYRGHYRGVYPIKVNQQEQVVQEITRAGRPFHFGLEAGSKAEFVAALAYMDDPESYLVSNGYKDSELVDLALYARNLGIQTLLVVETPEELPLILERSAALGIEPAIGVRIKLSSKSSGHWNDSGGDRSVFGLSVLQLVDLVDRLKAADMLHCLKLLHYHQGSQIPHIQAIREAAAEAARIYTSLVKEGAPMGLIDIGGGLAIDYQGGQSNQESSCNYSVEEYCADVIEALMQVFDAAKVDHPHIISESGRATVAHSSVLLFNVFEVTRFKTAALPGSVPENAPVWLQNLSVLYNQIAQYKPQEAYNDAQYYRDEARRAFRYGMLSLRERAHADLLYWNIINHIANQLEGMPPEEIPPDLEPIQEAMIDIYHVNFSVFQSLPDAWAIDQIFPIMPIHRLAEAPRRHGVMADITCDCDGKVDRFIDTYGIRRSLPLHDLREDEDYILGAFLIGAYQETLGDLHNLLGDTHVASVRLEEGVLAIEREIEGDTVADVLSYVEYEPKELNRRFRDIAERAVRKGVISPHQRKTLLSAYEASMRTYTYFND